MVWWVLEKHGTGEEFAYSECWAAAGLCVACLITKMFSFEEDNLF